MKLQCCADAGGEPAENSLDTCLHLIVVCQLLPSTSAAMPPPPDEPFGRARCRTADLGKLPPLPSVGIWASWLPATEFEAGSLFLAVGPAVRYFQIEVLIIATLPAACSTRPSTRQIRARDSLAGLATREAHAPGPTSREFAFQDISRTVADV